MLNDAGGVLAALSLAALAALGATRVPRVTVTRAGRRVDANGERWPRPGCLGKNLLDGRLAGVCRSLVDVAVEAWARFDGVPLASGE